MGFEGYEGFQAPSQQLAPPPPIWANTKVGHSTSPLLACTNVGLATLGKRQLWAWPLLASTNFEPGHFWQALSTLGNLFVRGGRAVIGKGRRPWWTRSTFANSTLANLTTLGEGGGGSVRRSEDAAEEKKHMIKTKESDRQTQTPN